MACLSSFPVELLGLVFRHFCSHCQSADNVIVDVAGLKTLRSLNRTCRVFHAVAEPILYHCFSTRCLDEWEPHPGDSHSRSLWAYISQLKRRRDLVPKIKVLEIIGFINLPLIPESEVPECVAFADELGVPLPREWNTTNPPGLLFNSIITSEVLVDILLTLCAETLEILSIQNNWHDPLSLAPPETEQRMVLGIQMLAGVEFGRGIDMDNLWMPLNPAAFPLAKLRTLHLVGTGRAVNHYNGRGISVMRVRTTVANRFRLFARMPNLINLRLSNGVRPVKSLPPSVKKIESIDSGMDSAVLRTLLDGSRTLFPSQRTERARIEEFEYRTNALLDDWASEYREYGDPCQSDLAPVVLVRGLSEWGLSEITHSLRRLVIAADRIVCRPHHLLRPGCMEKFVALEELALSMNSVYEMPTWNDGEDFKVGSVDLGRLLPPNIVHFELIVTNGAWPTKEIDPGRQPGEQGWFETYFIPTHDLVALAKSRYQNNLDRLRTVTIRFPWTSPVPPAIHELRPNESGAEHFSYQTLLHEFASREIEYRHVYGSFIPEA